ncbi:MAG: protein translocase subunit SecDF, partial [Prevotella sp.]|nr:protein translocase subunit SecDF [Prevotella sp.]
MQNKGIVIVTAILLTLASIFYLSFSAATSYYDSKAAQMSDPIAQQNYKDSVKYLGVYTYQQCLETQIGLGLDLKGGMNVILEISVPDVVDVLADHKTDAAYRKSLEEAKKEEETSQKDFITLFINAYHKNAPGHRLAEVFATQQLKGKVSTQSTDSEVETALRAEVQNAIDNSYNVVRNRIDKFGVVQPNIQKLEGQDGRLMVEMPGVREPERVRKLLQGSANLEFWETYNAQEVLPYLQQLDTQLANIASGKTTEEADSVKNENGNVNANQIAQAADTVKKEASAKFELKKTEEETKAEVADNKVASDAEIAKAKKQHPLFAIFEPVRGQSLSVVGYAHERDTAEIDKAIYGSEAKKIIPSDV